jgi:hypothetical protein
MEGSVSNRVWAFLGWKSHSSSPQKLRQSDEVPLLNRGRGRGHEHGARLPSAKLYEQIDAGIARCNEPIRPTDSKHFRPFAEAATVYDISSDLYFDASKVPPEVYEDVCKGGPIAAMHAVAEPLRKCGKSMYLQIRNHYARPWEHRWLESSQALGDLTKVAASEKERSQAREVLSRYVPREALKDAVYLLFANVRASGDAIWVDFQQFNEGLGEYGKSLADPQLQDLVAALTTCLQSFVNRRTAASWSKTYILYPVDAKVEMPG